MWIVSLVFDPSAEQRLYGPFYSPESAELFASTPWKGGWTAEVRFVIDTYQITSIDIAREVQAETETETERNS